MKQIIRHTALLEERPDGTYYLGPIEPGIRAVLNDMTLTMRCNYNAELGTFLYRVETLFPSHDLQTEAVNIASYGVAPTLDEAIRYCLGAEFGPMDADYNEEHLRAALEKEVAQ